MYGIYRRSSSHNRPDPEGLLLGEQQQQQQQQPDANELAVAANFGGIPAVRHSLGNNDRNVTEIPLHVGGGVLGGDECSAFGEASSIPSGYFDWWSEQEARCLLTTTVRSNNYNGNGNGDPCQGGETVISAQPLEHDNTTAEPLHEPSEEEEEDGSASDDSEEEEEATTSEQVDEDAEFAACYQELHSNGSDPRLQGQQQRPRIAFGGPSEGDDNHFDTASYTTQDINAIFQALNQDSSALNLLPKPSSSAAGVATERHQSTPSSSSQNNNSLVTAFENTTRRNAAAAATISSSSPPISTSIRARYISATIIKPSKRTNLGLQLQSSSDGAIIRIESVATEGFLFVSGAPLRCGDQVLCIKTRDGDYPCGRQQQQHPTTTTGGLKKNDILRLLRKTTGPLTIICKNEQGQPDTIESMTSKPHPHFGTGIFFVSGTPNWKALQIHSVPANGLFAHSLLRKDDQVLFINGIDCTGGLDACVATDIVKSAPRYVSIVAQTTMETIPRALLLGAANRSVVTPSISSANANDDNPDPDDPGAFLRSVPEVTPPRRSSFSLFSRRK